MPKFKVKNAYYSKSKGRRVKPGEEVEVSAENIGEMQRKNLIEDKPIVKKKQAETATNKPDAENRITFDDLKQKPGGWYEFPDGETVQGKGKAKERLKKYGLINYE